MQGLTAPLVWNSSGYEREAVIEGLSEYVRVFLLDIKTLDPAVAGELFGSSDYPTHATRAVMRAVRMSRLEYEGNLLTSGVVVRHLHIPGRLASTRKVLEWFAAEIGDRALLSLMFQYVPVGSSDVGHPKGRTNRREYETALRWLSEFGIEEGFVQEPVSDEEWLPDFSRTDPFPSALSRPVWNWVD